MQSWTPAEFVDSNDRRDGRRERDVRESDLEGESTDGLFVGGVDVGVHEGDGERPETVGVELLQFWTEDVEI